MENRLSQDKKLLAEFIFKIRKYFMYNPPPAPPGAGVSDGKFYINSATNHNLCLIWKLWPQKSCE